MRDNGPLMVDIYANLYKALGNPIRLKMALAMQEQGEVCVGDLQKAAGFIDAWGQSAVSQHLAKMRNLGAVETRRDRQKIYYRLSAPAKAILQ